MLSYKVESAKVSSETLEVTTSDGKKHEYLYLWLRDNCQCSECFNSDTYQRVFDSYSVPEDIHATGASVIDDGLSAQWSDGHESIFTNEWLQLHTAEYTKPNPYKEDLYPAKVFWDKEYIEANKPSVPFDNVMNGDLKELFNNIHTYGFTYIHDVPKNAEMTKEMCEKILPLRHTHYGGFWDFTTDLAMKDTAYSDIEIKSHTDGTYWEYTPYLQLFHLLFHDGEGGLTTLVDSFKCAQDMQREFPEEFKTLSEVEIECHSLGDVHLVERKPVFIHDKNGKLLQISWNNCDRSTNYHLDNETLKRLYKALRCWNKILTREENVSWKKLVPGEVLLFDNWRVLHARMKKTTGKRRMCGVYFDRYDFLSSLRKVNCQSEEVLYKSST